MADGFESMEVHLIFEDGQHIGEEWKLEDQVEDIIHIQVLDLTDLKILK